MDEKTTVAQDLKLLADLVFDVAKDSQLPHRMVVQIQMQKFKWLCLGLIVALIVGAIVFHFWNQILGFIAAVAVFGAIGAGLFFGGGGYGSDDDDEEDDDDDDD